ncbi:MAG TPA: class II aldolase/adducin family protein [Terriglobales bacterium]
MHIRVLREVVSAEERQLRCDPAACQCLVAPHGWTDPVFTHFSVRLLGDAHEFRINPYGLLPQKKAASSLLRVDAEGDQLTGSPVAVSRVGFVIHSAIHAARPDVLCVPHTHIGTS